ncbi:proteasome assembly chaperone family protein [Halocalculus aciditolerans]|uniref:Proteasome assembly chaperone family protein n=1 Tax=Halocalculus aciditolerans TaxID=1383812 RepID=A0A830F7C2_9EURY|nr:proteasome assembly chaperone family protein [Halocalculus aciditolerans]GGL61572.1 proteasome assembly chaperone family protein [Halocalculus aciditolerans]
MEEILVESVEEASLDDPVLVEGLPGVGHVGKLVAEHLVEETESTLVRRVHSEHFPPQVEVDDDGVGSLASVDFYACPTDGRDLLVLTGNHQASDGPGHYRVAETFLDVADDFDVSDVFALGGVPTGELVDEYTVVGAVSDADLKPDLDDAGVEFRAEEPAGGIVGTSGLLVGLGGRRGFHVACLMGETSGYLVDPKSAAAVLDVLETHLDFETDHDALDDRADEMEDVVEQMQQMEGQQQAPSEEDLRYIG